MTPCTIFQKSFLILLMLAFSSQAHPYALCVAHRGIHAKKNDAPENSLKALTDTLSIQVEVNDQTIILPADGVDYDVNHSQDGIGFVYHDPIVSQKIQMWSTDPATGLRIHCPHDQEEIASLTAAQFEACVLKNGETAPRLSTLLKVIEEVILPRNPGFRLSLEFKDKPSPDSLARVHDFYNNHPKNIEILSFAVDILNVVDAYQEGSPIPMVQNALFNADMFIPATYQEPDRFPNVNFCYGIGEISESSFIADCFAAITPVEDLKLRLQERMPTGLWTVNAKDKIQTLVDLAYEDSTILTELRIISDDPATCIQLREEKLRAMAQQRSKKDGMWYRYEHDSTRPNTSCIRATVQRDTMSWDR